MLDLIAQPLNFLVSLLVIGSIVLSFFNNRKKADKTDVTNLYRDMLTLRKELLAQQAVSRRLQQQIDEKNKQIHALQEQNAQEEKILQNRDPKLEETLALLAQGQATILELLSAAQIDV